MTIGVFDNSLLHFTILVFFSIKDLLNTKKIYHRRQTKTLKEVERKKKMFRAAKKQS